jgi:hypothetical protein
LLGKAPTVRQRAVQEARRARKQTFHGVQLPIIRSKYKVFDPVHFKRGDDGVPAGRWRPYP